MLMRLGHSHMCGKSKIFYPHIYFAGILPFTWKRHRHMPVCIRREVCFRPRGKSQSADRKANNVQGYSHSRGKKYKCLAALYVIVGILPLAWEKASRAILLLHFFGYTPTCVGKVNSFILHIYFAGILPFAWEKVSSHACLHPAVGILPLT